MYHIRPNIDIYTPYPTFFEDKKILTFGSEEKHVNLIRQTDQFGSDIYF